MTVKEMRSLLEYLPDDTVIELFNDAAEWYGIEVIDSGAWQTVNGKLVLMFGNYKWDKHALESYYRENKAMSNYYEARYNRHNEKWRGVVYTYRRDDRTVDGPLYSRMFLALHEVWRLLRQALKGGE